MRNITISLTLALFNFLFLSGQIVKPITKKNITIGGNISFTQSIINGDDNYSYHLRAFQFSPSIGYFVIDGLSIGLSPTISFNSSSIHSSPIESLSNSTYSSINKVNSFGVSPFVKYYFTNGIFINAALRFTYNRQKTDYSITGIYPDINGDQIIEQNSHSTNVNNSMGYTIGAGYAYFINSKVSLEASAQYSNEFEHSHLENNSSTNDNHDKTSNIFISIGFNIFL